MSDTLHNDAVARSSALLLKVDLARKLLQTNPIKAGAVLDALRENLRTAGRELRYSMFLANPETFYKEGLVAACMQLAALQKEVYEFTVSVSVSESPAVPEQMMYAVIEAVANCRRHSQVSEAQILIQQMLPDIVTVQIVDHGVGFDVSKADGIGLRLMHHWMRACGGEFKVESREGLGTTVALSVPIFKDRR